MIIIAKWKKEGVQMDKIVQMGKALKNIDAIVDAYYKGTLNITSEKNGYCDGSYGLDVIMSIIKNQIIDGTQTLTEKKGGHLYV